MSALRNASFASMPYGSDLSTMLPPKTRGQRTDESERRRSAPPWSATTIVSPETTSTTRP